MAQSEKDTIDKLNTASRELVLFCGHDVAYFVTTENSPSDPTLRTYWSSCCPVRILSDFDATTPVLSRPDTVAAICTTVWSEALKTRKLRESVCRPSGHNPPRDYINPHFIERNDIRTIKERRLAIRITKLAQKLADSDSGTRVMVCGLSRLKVPRIKPLKFIFDTAERSASQMCQLYVHNANWDCEKQHMEQLLVEMAVEIEYLEMKKNSATEVDLPLHEACVHCWKGEADVVHKGALVWCEACGLGSHIGCLTPALSELPHGAPHSHDSPYTSVTPVPNCGAILQL